jgi:hypothetical protein
MRSIPKRWTAAPDRHSVARKKPDAGDALVLTHILRTDRAAHRPLPADSEPAQAIAVFARADTHSTPCRLATSV